MDQISLQPIIPALALSLVGLAALAILLVGPSFANLSPGRRWTLAGLRLGVMAMLLLMMLRPGCVQKIEKRQAAVILFLIDSTRSMQLPHLTDESTRWGAVEAMLRENESRFQKLIENQIDVEFYRFDNRVEPLAFENGNVALPTTPDGSETDIGSAIYDTSLDARDRRVLATFLASDGVQNVTEPGIELVDSTDTLFDLEVPLFAVQTGRLADNSAQLADVAITNFAEQMVVNKKNELTAQATLTARGYPNQDVKVELLVGDSDGREQIVATEFYRPSSSYEEINVKLKYQPSEAGEYRIKVRAAPMVDELAIRNNELDGFLTVRDEGMRVLFLSGAPGNEQQFLRPALAVIGFMKVDFVPIYPYPQARAQWPKSFLSEFSDPDLYDVFILCNLDSRALYDPANQESLQALADAVTNGKGLLMLGGSHSFGPGLYHSTPLADILPVEMNRSERQEFEADFRSEFHINQPIKVAPTIDNFVTRISDNGDNRSAWKNLPPLPGANRLSVKNTAEVWLQSDDDVRRPILIATNVGGRVLAFASDSSWIWKRKGFAEEYNKFWRQAVLWLAFWDARNDESVSIDLPKRRFAPRAIVGFDVQVKSLSGVAVENVEFEASLKQPSGESQTVLISQIADRYRSELDPESLAEAGSYRIQVTARRDGSLIGTTEREFVVMDRDQEKANPAANPEQMARLASQTAQFGGRAIAPEDVSAILDQFIENPPTTKIEIPLRWRLGESLGDATAFLLGFVGLLAIEWFLRKKWGLV